MEETNVPKTREEHLDFRIGALIINLTKLTVLVKQRDQNYSSWPDFERSILSFMNIFRGHVLTDSRMLLFSSSLAESEKNDSKESDLVDTIEGVYNESQNAYDTLAQLFG
eukprot:CAMPEP_0176348042 /NCGR_PEP_ID=MMETSP0126-20121128/7559_1 /TAXON_ID=141414 ORGANISM="Strombidinopsis acuminatum, Strain SPMC142" /NCGR_SAMPLE_ID=MMETSP0126 /ASSEMBLY_ACC=CAM_ASM_000229 /LENGTH=109 /DNA_ID=CAMNT_0017696617 /DNA_START=622 /DNA_END=951 /DNA_ORIENTATION=+